MKIFIFAVRLLFGGIFILYGLSKFHAFMPTPPMQPKAARFIGVLVETGYLWQMIGLVEVVSGICIISGYFLSQALILLAPVLVNIILYLLILQNGIGFPPVVMSIFLLCSYFLLAYERRAFFAKVLT